MRSLGVRASGQQNMHHNPSSTGFRLHILSANKSFLVALRTFLIETEAVVSIPLNTTTAIWRGLAKWTCCAHAKIQSLVLDKPTHGYFYTNKINCEVSYWEEIVMTWVKQHPLGFFPSLFPDAGWSVGVHNCLFCPSLKAACHVNKETNPIASRGQDCSHCPAMLPCACEILSGQGLGKQLNLCLNLSVLIMF